MSLRLTRKGSKKDTGTPQGPKACRGQQNTAPEPVPIFEAVIHFRD
jgi:hypothetical protein